MEESSLAAHRGLKKMVVLKINGMFFFYNFFVCAVHVGLLGYYVLNWAVWII